MRHKENIFKLRAEGKSYGQIQDELGCSKSTISYHLGQGQTEKSRVKKNTKILKQTLKEYKEKLPCTDCNKYYPSHVLDFDHIGKNKIASVSDLVRFSGNWNKILLEIEKCEIVCANCHRERTHNRLITK